MPSEGASVELTRRFQRVLARIGGRAAAVTAREWDGLGSWNRPDVARFAERVADPLSAAQRAAVNASAGYYSVLSSTPPATVELALGADMEAPFTAYWHGLSEHRPWVEAFAAGRSRAESTAVDVVTDASRRIAGVTAGTGVVGWRRVLTGDSCPWCSDVALQRYGSQESATFGHDNCDCIVVPIYGDRDPGQVINAQFRSQIAEGVPGVRV